MSMLKEFKEFALRGNVVDLAVGVIIGGAFGKVITSVVNDILMPPIGKAMGGVNFSDMFINLDPGKKLPNGDPITSLAQAKTAGVAVIAYGQFINTILDFMIVAACIFAVVKGMNTLKRRLDRTPPTGPATKECPECLSAIPIKAKRCAHCAQVVP
jgi:large conductance mechanosensitive channel